METQMRDVTDPALLEKLKLYEEKDVFIERRY